MMEKGQADGCVLLAEAMAESTSQRGRKTAPLLWLLVSAFAFPPACGGQTDPAPVCDPGGTLCGKICVNLLRDHDHCGVCMMSCGAGEVCWNGTCGVDCGGGTTKCSQACYDTTVDPNNCGACGVACGAGLVCSAGVCQSTCVGSQTLCEPPNAQPYCASTQTDNANCGTCGNVCDPSLGCVGGVCAPACAAGQTACFPLNATPYCANTSSDPGNCGTCAFSCGGGDGVCQNGQCSCLGTKTWCGACTDTQTDNANCGACGAICNGTCSRGRCILTIGTNYFQSSGNWLAADSNGVYVATGGQVAAIPNGGGSSTNLTAAYSPLGTIESLAIDPSNVYFVDRYGSTQSRLCRVAKTGGSVAILGNVVDGVFNITADTNNLYARGWNSIYAVPVGGGSVNVLASSDGNVWSVPALASDGTNVYWATLSGLEMVAVGGGSTANIYAGSLGWVIADGGYVYFEGQTLARTKPSWNGASQSVFLGYGPLAFSQAIYFGVNPTIWSIDRNTLAATPLVDDFTLATYGPMAAGPSHLFWVDNMGNIKQTTL